MTEQSRNRGKSVVIAGIGINLALGVLYGWSLFKDAISRAIESGEQGGFTWDLATLNDPYAVALLVFACSMIVAGRIQDRFGPRLTAILGGVLVGMGFILISQTNAYWAWIFGFGCLVGAGIGFGYSAATPAALKWYPPRYSGRIAGIVVAGFGLASVYIAPLTNWLLHTQGVSNTMMIFGIAFMIVVSIFAMFLVNPPKDYQPEADLNTGTDRRRNRKGRSRIKDNNLSPSDMLRTFAFWRTWLLFFIGAGGGLMVIGSVSGMAKSSLAENAFLAIAFLGIGDASGRFVSGLLADRFGRQRSLTIVFGLQALMMFAAIPVISVAEPNALLLVTLATAIGFNYGANLALFPTIVKDLWGMKNFGVNYGILFTAWGAGGFVMSRISQALQSSSGDYTNAFVLSGLLLLVGVVILLVYGDEKEKLRRQMKKNA